jgi:hypothetical protein
VSGHARDALAQRIEPASSGVALRAKEPLSDELRQMLARDEEQLRKLTVLDFDERSSVGASVRPAARCWVGRFRAFRPINDSCSLVLRKWQRPLQTQRVAA